MGGRQSDMSMNEEEFIDHFSAIVARVQPEHRDEFLQKTTAIIENLEDRQFDANYFGQIAQQYIGANDTKDTENSTLFQAGKGLRKFFQKVTKWS